MWCSWSCGMVYWSWTAAGGGGRTVELKQSGAEPRTARLSGVPTGRGIGEKVGGVYLCVSDWSQPLGWQAELWDGAQYTYPLLLQVVQTLESQQAWWGQIEARDYLTCVMCVSFLGGKWTCGVGWCALISNCCKFMVAHTFNTSIHEIGRRISVIQGQAGLHSKL